MDTLEHLSEETKKIVGLPDSERIFSIRAGTWIGYSRAKEVLEHMEELLSYPRVTRMPNMLLVAQSFNGKTTILDRFMSLHPPEVDPNKDRDSCPVVSIEAPPKPDIGDLYIRILDFIRAPYKPRSSPAENYSQIKKLFKALDVKMLIVDEIHHLIAGNLKRQQEFRNALKSLGNETSVSMVVAGISDAYNAFSTDPQMLSRFTPVELPLWRADKEFGSLLATLERRLPLRRASNLKDPQLMLAIHTRSEGTVGDMHDLVKELSIEAIKTKTECITLDRIHKLPWAPPSQRKQHGRT